MSKFLFAPFMMNLGESQRLSKLANYLYEQGHDIHILGDNYYPFLFNNDAYRYHHCVEDKSVYNSKRYDAFFSLSTDFNFLSEEEIERICSIERDLLRQEKFDAVLTGYRLSIVTSCRLESIPLIWIISGATHISEIVENSEGILPNGKISKASKPQTKDFIKRVITTYSTNVKTWNNYIKKYGGKPFNNALELFTGDLNLVTDYSLFYEFDKDSSYKTIGPILIDNVGFSKCSQINQDNKTVLLSFGTSFKRDWVESFLKTLPRHYHYLLTSCGEAINIPGSYIEVVDFIDFKTIDKEIYFAIIHGGQGTVYAMAAQGIPFIGIPFFNEQFWNIKKFSKEKCAYLVKKPDVREIRKAISCLERDYDIYKSYMIRLSQGIKEEAEASLQKAEAEIESFIRKRQS